MNRTIPRSSSWVGLVLAAVTILAACSSGTASSAPSVAPTAPPAAASAAAPSTAAGGGATGDGVSIKDFSFDPAELTVKVGAKVTWTNQGDASHTVTFDTGGVTSDTLKAGATYDHVFDAAGSFAYHCNFHSSMKGVIVVAP